MTDTVLIQHGKAHEIFAGRTLAEMALRRHPDLVAAMVEAADGSVEVGDVWDGSAFSRPVPPVLPRGRDVFAEIDALMADVERIKQRLGL